MVHMSLMITDILIIGAGAVGCAVARELSRYKLKVVVVDKEYDVAAGTSGRNSAVVHAGFNNKPGSLMARLCVEGNAGFETLCKELDVPYKKTGKFVVAFDEEDQKTLQIIYKQGLNNGCKGLRILDGEELKRRLPDVGGISAMESIDTAIFDPFLYTVALAENASCNGVLFRFGEEVKNIEKIEGKERERYSVTTDKRTYKTRYVVNCAGVGSVRVAQMLGFNQYKLYPCRGEYLILDKIAEKFLQVPVYPAPKKGIGGLGVHLTPTIHGNIIIGPSAEYIEDGEDYSSTKLIIDKLFDEAKKLLPTLERKHIIGAYSGIRSKQAPPSEGGFHDFLIQEEPECKGFINLIGIESPGMTASMPIARMVCNIIGHSIDLNPNLSFNPIRKGILKFSDQNDEEKDRLIKINPEYGEVVCRCQNVTKAEICQAIENPLGVKSIASIKYRVWATTGRCNGGYCFARIAEILEKDYGINPEDITLRGKGSEYFIGRVK